MSAQHLVTMVSMLLPDWIRGYFHARRCTNSPVNQPELHKVSEVGEDELKDAAGCGYDVNLNLRASV